MWALREQDMVSAEEVLARFVLQSRHLRQDQTVRPDAFIPHPWPDLSVTRHLKLNEAAIWDIGRDVAKQIGKTLYCRADVNAGVVLKLQLRVLAAPTEKNPNHANVVDWPVERSAQKILAQEISAAAGKAKIPPAG